MTAKATKKTQEKAQEPHVITSGKPALAHGRTFSGFVTKKFDKRLVIEFERTLYVKKYERFTKKKTRIHARIPENMTVHVGDYVKVRECRPISKIIHFIVTEVVREAGA